MAFLMMVIAFVLTVVHGFLAFANVGDDLLFTLHIIAASVWAVNIPLWAMNALDDM